MKETLASRPVAEAPQTGARLVAQPAWTELKNAVSAIRPAQSKDGSIDFDAEGAPSRADVTRHVERVIAALRELTPLLPHDAAYHRAVEGDLRRWVADGFGVPDFLDALLAFQPSA